MADGNRITLHNQCYPAVNEMLTKDNKPLGLGIRLKDNNSSGAVERIPIKWPQPKTWNQSPCGSLVGQGYHHWLYHLPPWRGMPQRPQSLIMHKGCRRNKSIQRWKRYDIRWRCSWRHDNKPHINTHRDL